MVLDRASGSPLYEQVYDALRMLIEAGEARPGERLPTELELAARYGVNRLTVRHALAELGRSGLIVARQGSGTFVAERRPPLEVDLTPTDWVVEQERGARAAAQNGMATSESLLEVEPVDARGEALEHLGRGRLLRLESLIRYDGEPAIRSQYWMRSRSSAAEVRERAVAGFGPHALVELVGADMYYTWRSFDAIAAARRDASVLGVPVGSPLLKRCGLNSDSDGRPLLYLERLAPSTRMRIIVRNTPPVRKSAVGRPGTGTAGNGDHTRTPRPGRDVPV